VELIKVKERQEARSHAATWKLLSSFAQKQVQPELPPSSIYEHYKRLSQVTESPLTADAVPQLFIGPLTKEDAALEADVSAEETRRALEDINRRSAPGPDGLPPTLVVNAFGVTALVLFLARFLTRCF
jgi:hypothetical protein